MEFGEGYMKIITINQRSEEWLLYRNNGIGSSDIAVIMGLNKYSSLNKLYMGKMGLSTPKRNNFAMQRGVDYEKEALLWVSSALGVELLPICVEDEGDPWMRASIDGYNVQQNLVVEIKIPKPQNYAMQCDFLEDMHHCQVQWQMGITRGPGYVCVYSPEKSCGHLHEICIDTLYQDSMKKMAYDFWSNHVLIGEPPTKRKI